MLQLAHQEQRCWGVLLEPWGHLLLAVSPRVPQTEDFQCLAGLSQRFCYTSVFYPLLCSPPVSFSLLSVCLGLDLDGEWPEDFEGYLRNLRLIFFTFF